MPTERKCPDSDLEHYLKASSPADVMTLKKIEISADEEHGFVRNIKKLTILDKFGLVEG